jgi:hypothetical protein
MTVAFPFAAERERFLEAREALLLRAALAAIFTVRPALFLCPRPCFIGPPPR